MEQEHNVTGTTKGSEEKHEQGFTAKEAAYIEKLAAEFARHEGMIDPHGYSLQSIVDGMIIAMAQRPSADHFMPLLQEGMDILREIKPDTNKSAEQTVLTIRAFLSSPNVN